MKYISIEYKGKKRKLKQNYLIIFISYDVSYFVLSFNNVERLFAAQCNVQFSSGQNGINAPGKDHTRSTLSFRSFPGAECGLPIHIFRSFDVPFVAAPWFACFHLQLKYRSMFLFLYALNKLLLTAFSSLKMYYFKHQYPDSWYTCLQLEHSHCM